MDYNASEFTGQLSPRRQQNILSLYQWKVKHYLWDFYNFIENQSKVDTNVTYMEVR